MPTEPAPPSPSQQAFDRKNPVIETRAQVERMTLKPEAKLVLLYLLEREARVYERAEIAQDLSVRPAYAERGIIMLRNRAPFLCARTGPDGEPLRGRHAFIPKDAKVRAAWANVAVKEDLRPFSDPVGAAIERVVAAEAKTPKAPKVAKTPKAPKAAGGSNG